MTTADDIETTGAGHVKSQVKMSIVNSWATFRRHFTASPSLFQSDYWHGSRAARLAK